MTVTVVRSLVLCRGVQTSQRHTHPADHSSCQPRHVRRRGVRVCAVEDDQEEDRIAVLESKRSADSTDAVSSFLTRRFGIGAGLAWLGILAVGSLGEQIKTRLEVKREEEGAKKVASAKAVTLSSGVKYKDNKIGGGSRLYKGALTAIRVKGSVMDENSEDIFEDTFASGKQIVFLFGSRPLSDVLCIGLEEAMETMKTGGIREVIVPPEAGFGSKGTVLFSGKANEKAIPPDATLKYLVELKRVSIAP